MRVLGIDASTKTGLAVLDGDESFVKLLHIEGIEGFERLQLIAVNFDHFLEARKPDVAFIEEYALGLQKSGSTIITQIEIGTILRVGLHHHGIPWRMIRPSTLKLWVGGPGQGGMNKDGMAEYVAARWGFKNKSNDIVDAYALARMGQHLLAVEVEKYPKGVAYGYGPLGEIAV
jgi:crossover junction endodeoxyribonuclease RuvC